MTARTRMADRVAQQLAEDPTDACVNWPGAIDRGGYGQARFGDRQFITAHRAVWIATHGQPPVGLHLDHLCRNKACVNPKHLELVTPAENNRRRMQALLGFDYEAECRYGHPRTPENVKYHREKSGRIRYRCMPCRRAQNAKNNVEKVAS